MKTFWLKYKYHILLVLIGIIWISFFDFITQMSSQGVMHSDSFNYQESAKNLYVFFRGHNYRPILMALISGIPYLFGGSDESIFAFSFYVNLLCLLGSIVLLFEVSRAFVKLLAFIIACLIL